MSRCHDTDCDRRHCVVCAREHTDDTCPQTCPGCVHTVRDNLAAIVDMHTRLEDQATHTHADGRLNTGPLGGDAMVMLADGRYLPASRITCDEQRNDPLPPLLVLATWEDDIRLTIGHKPAGRATITDAAGYLDQHLTMIAQRHPAFDELAADLDRLRGRLEAVLCEGDREDETRTPCITCGTRLVRRYGRRVSDDHHQCPRCQRRYIGDEFVRAKHHHLASEEAATWVLLSHAAQIVDRSGRTVRTWVNRLQVTAYCDPVTHRVYVWWPDVRELELMTRRRGVA